LGRYKVARIATVPVEYRGIWEWIINAVSASKSPLERHSGEPVEHGRAVEHAIPGAQRSLFVWRVSEANPRTEITPIAIDKRALAGSPRSFASKHHRSFHSRQWINDVQIEVRTTIGDFRNRWLVFVAEAKIQRQLAAYLKVIMNETGIVVGASAGNQWNSDVGIVDATQPERSERVTDEVNAGDSRLICRKVESAREITLRSIVLLVAANIEAELGNAAP